MTQKESLSVGEKVARQIEHERYMTIFQRFAQTVAPLAIVDKHLAGNVMIIGQGPAFPERILVCTSKSRFQTIRPAINLLVCCDGELFTHPSNYLDGDIDTNIEDIRRVKTRIASYSWGAQYALKQHFPDNYLDTIMAFEIVSLSKQLQEGLMDEISRVLKPHGHFIGSGCLNDESYYDRLSEDLHQPMRSVQQVNLGNPSQMSFPFMNHHRGVILQKS